MKNKRQNKSQIVPTTSDTTSKRKKRSLGNIFCDENHEEAPSFAATLPTIVRDTSDDVMIEDILTDPPTSPLDKIRSSLCQTAPIKLQTPTPTIASPEATRPGRMVRIHDITFSHIVPIKWTRKCDPYVVITIGETTLETNIQWDSDATVMWRDLNYYTSLATNMRIDIYDANVIREDVLMASHTCPVKHGDIKQRLHDAKGKYRGELLVHISLEDVNLPVEYVCEGHLNRLRRLQDKHKIVTSADTSLNIDRTPSTEADSKILDSEAPSGSKRIEVSVPSAKEVKNSKTLDRRESKGYKSLPKGESMPSAPVIAEAKPSLNIEQPRKEIALPAAKPLPVKQTSRPVEIERNREHKREALRVVDLPKQESKQISESSSKKTKKKSISAPTPSLLVGCADISPDAHRVIDQIFERVLGTTAANITLTYYEVGMVFDALGAAIDLEALKSQWKCTVVLSLTSEKLFAAILTEFARETLGNRLFTMTEESAKKALKHLNSLVQGPYKKFRKLVLETAEMTNKRPYAWSTKILVKIAKIMQFPVAKFETSSFGALIDRDGSALVEEFDIIPSILQLRFQVYLAVLKRIDELWLEGIFPKDLTYRKPLPTSNSEPIISLQNLNDQEVIQISNTDKLLKSYLPLNRAYGWGVTLEAMTQLAAVIGGCSGKISPGFGNVKMKGVKWVALMNEDALAALRSMNIHPVSGRHVAVPISCIKLHKKDKCINTPPVASSSVTQFTVGMNVQISDIERLASAYDRFEWWERPPEDILQAFAGSMGEVISVAQLSDPHRLVGVRVMKDGKEIIDAVPVEALSVPSPKRKPKQPPPSTVANTNVINSNIVSNTINKRSQKSEAKTISQSQSLETPQEDTDIYSNHMDMWAVGGGDESAPPDMLSAQDIHTILAPSARVPTAPVVSRNAVQDRPLYRPKEASQKINLDSYGWLNPKRMDASFDVDTTREEYLYSSPKQKRRIETPEKRSPKLTVTTAQLEPEGGIQRSHREKSQKMKHAEDTKKASLLYAEDKLPEASIDEDDFGIEGFGLSASSRRNRPKSAAPTKKSVPAKERPKSAAGRRSKRDDSDVPSAYAWLSRPIKPIKNVSDSIDPKINENLWRELRRSERDMHAKEVDLRRKLKKMGVSYNSTHA